MLDISISDRALITYISLSNKNKIKCVIDTGAELSIIKPDKVLKEKIDFKNKVSIQGVAKDQLITSIGLIATYLNFNNFYVKHKFHVIKKDLNLNADAVLGNDFLMKTHACINYRNKTMTIYDIENNGHLLLKSPPKSISSFQSIKKYQKYFHAIGEYEQSNPKMLMYSQKNDNFYEQLPLETFENYEKIDTVKLNVQTDIQDIFPIIDSNIKSGYSISYYGLNQNVISDPNERLDYLMNKLDLNHLNEQIKQKVKQICYEYSDAFYIEGDILKPTTAYVHSIKLKPNIDTVFVKQYRIPENQKEEMEKQIADLEKKKIIEKSTSRFNSPLLLVKKAPDEKGNPQFRLVLDYRKVNEATIPQAYPIPLIDEIIDQMHDATCFTELDIQSAFHQIMLDENCRHITAFSTTHNHYQFRTVPFRLQSSPAAWLHTITRVLQKFINRNLFTYMDDIVLSTADYESSLNLLKKVLKQLIRFNLKLKPEKCSLLQNSIKYLGFKLSKTGVEIDESKI